ncbi:hypothetical protein Tco_0438741 [Tanacetum coccineum]
MDKRKRHFAAKRAEAKRKKPPTKAQKRKTMSTYLKNMDGWKLDQLKGKCYSEVEKLFYQAMARINNFVGMDLAEEAKKLEGTSKRAGYEIKRKARKKQKMDDEEIAKLQALIEITLDEEELPINAIPLAIKPPAIVDYGIYKEGIVGFYKITRADGLDTLFRVFSILLYSFDRKDLETLLKLVKERHGDIRPVEGFDMEVIYFMWSAPSQIFKCSSLHVGRKYPLTKPTLTDMLNKKLQVDHCNEIAYQLLKLITRMIEVNAVEEFTAVY